MPSYNTHFVDLGYSYYPAKIDSRDGIDPETGSANLTEFAINEYLELNVNYEDRGSSPTADDFYVLAEDVNVLQDAVLALERIIGQMPHVRTDVGVNDVTSVSERIAKLEDITRFDERFGGAGWINGVSPTILSHTHTGGANDCAKIDLGTMTTGELGKTRLQLDITDADPLTSAHIPYTATNSTSIKTMLDGKADKAIDNTFNGNITIKGNFISRSYAEVDGRNLMVTTQSGGGGVPFITEDAYAFCGEALQHSKAGGILPQYTHAVTFFTLRYNEYGIIVRMKTDNVLSDSNLVRVVISGSTTGAGNTVLWSQYIKCTEFKTAGEYQSFYFTVDHKRLAANAINKNLYVRLYYYGNTVADLAIDSVVATPLHTSVWDKE